MADEFIPISQLPAGQEISTESGIGTINNFIVNEVFNPITLTVDGSHRIAWDVNAARSAMVPISANAVLQVPTNMAAGGKYDLTVISSNNAQLTFEGSNIYQFNIGSFPFFINGKTILEFNSDGTGMACVGVNTGYAPFTPLEDSSPNTWYTTRKVSAYTGTPTNITAVNDFGSNAITASKSGTGNIVLTANAINTVDGFDFGSGNTNRDFDLGTPNASAFMNGGAMTMMAMVKASTVDNVARVLFSWSSAFKDFYLGYNTSTTQIDAFVFDNITGTGIVSGNSSTIGTSPTLLTWVKNPSGTSYLYSNGVQIGSATQIQSTTGTATQCQLGNFNAGGLFPMQGSIGDFVVWNRSLSDKERSNIEIELMSIYGVL